MPLNSSAVHSLRRVFQQGFIAYDLAEALVSFDDSVPVEEACRAAQAHAYEIVGVRQHGCVEGYLDLAGAGDGVCGDYVQPFAEDQVISETAPLAELVHRLRDHRRLFVSVLGRVGGIISRTDLQKPPFRMWLFGMVTLIEMRFCRLIATHCPDDRWKEFLSDGRIRKAEALLAERRRRNQDLSLLDCLQLSDVAQIVARNEQLRGMTRFDSRRKLEQAAKDVEKLRNNLAHSQDIISNDWDTIVVLAEKLDEVLEGPPGFRDAGG